jgi:hypothetical protein
MHLVAHIVHSMLKLNEKKERKLLKYISFKYLYLNLKPQRIQFKIPSELFFENLSKIENILYGF